MLSPLSANLKRRLASALAAAMVWQIGACPCGCVDHNLWLEIYRSLAVGAASVSDNSIDSFEADDCDHRPRDSFARARTADEDAQSRMVASLQATFLDFSAPTTRSPARRPCRRGFIETPRFSSAQEMRAHLQVFLI